MSCNKYVPSLKDCFVLLGGSGDSVLLKSITIKYVKRVGVDSKPSRKGGCCSVF